MIEFKDENPMEYRKIMRGVKKERPFGNKRFTSKINYTLIANNNTYQPTAPPRISRVEQQDEHGMSRNNAEVSRYNSRQQEKQHRFTQHNWLADQWWSRHKRNPTVREIIDGILQEAQI